MPSEYLTSSCKLLLTTLSIIALNVNTGALYLIYAVGRVTQTCVPLFAH